MYVHVSFICMLILYIWYFSNVFTCLPFFCMFLLRSNCLIPYLCHVLSIWVEHAELLVYVLCIWYGMLYPSAVRI